MSFSPGCAWAYSSKGSVSLTPEKGSQVVSGKSCHFTSKKYLLRGMLRVSPGGRCDTIWSMTYSFLSVAASLVNSLSIVSSSNHAVLNWRQSLVDACFTCIVDKSMRSSTGWDGSFSLRSATRKGPVHLVDGLPFWAPAVYIWRTKSPTLNSRGLFPSFCFRWASSLALSFSKCLLCTSSVISRSRLCHAMRAST